MKKPQKIEAGVLQNMVLNPTTYEVFQDQPGFERERKKQCSEMTAKRVSKSVILRKHEKVLWSFITAVSGKPKKFSLREYP